MKSILTILAISTLGLVSSAALAGEACKKCCKGKCAECCKDKGKECGKDCCKEDK